MKFVVEATPCDFGGIWYSVGYHGADIFQSVAFFFERDDAESYANWRNNES